MEFAGGRRRRDRHALGERDRTGVEAGIHLHDHHARLGVAGHDGALDRCGAAPARQQRGVAVVAAEPRAFEDGRRQEQPVGDDHGDVGSERAEGGLLGLALQRNRRKHRYAQPLGLALHRRRRQFQAAAAGRARRLGVDGDDLVARLGQRAQRGDREFGRSHEDDAQRHCFPKRFADSRTRRVRPPLQTGLQPRGQARRSRAGCGWRAWRHAPCTSRRSWHPWSR